jgi:hypothetical protein
VPSSFLSSTSAICEVGGRGSSRCGGVPNEGRRGVSRDRGTRWLEVVFDLRSWLNADANGRQVLYKSTTFWRSLCRFTNVPLPHAIP